MTIGEKTKRHRTAVALLLWRKIMRWSFGKGTARFNEEYLLATGVASPYRYLEKSKFYKTKCNTRSKNKRCSICKNLLSVNLFYMHNGFLSSECKVCTSKLGYDKRLKEDRSEYFKQYSKTDVAKLSAKRCYEKRKKLGTHLDHKHRRKARLKASRPNPDTKTFVLNSPDVVRCNWCHKKMKKSKASVDHIVPLFRGGAHSAYNLCWCCLSCNSSKGAKMPNSWVKDQLVLEMA